MSHSTPSQPTPHSQRRPLLPPTATPRFSPYPPAALRTSLFSQRAPTPSTSSSNSILSTPRSLALPPRFSTVSPHPNGQFLPPPPQNTPLSNSTSSAFGPLRSTAATSTKLYSPLQLRSTSSTKKPKGSNPFDKLTANDFNQFVDGLKAKVKNALDPEVERKRKREEREARQRLRDEKERERERLEKLGKEEEEAEKESSSSKDVFGEVKNVGQQEEDEDLINGQQIKTDSNQRSQSSEEEEEEEEEEEDEEESLEFERVKSKPNGTPTEIVILDSDEESEEERERISAQTGSADREEREDSIVDSIVDSIEDDYSQVEDEDEAPQSASSRSPTPNSLPSSSPEKSHNRRVPQARNQIDYPSLSRPTTTTTTATRQSRRISSSPDAVSVRKDNNGHRERSPLFRPRNEGSVSLSAPEDYDLEAHYFSQQEEEEEEEEEEEAEEEDGREMTDDRGRHRDGHAEKKVRRDRPEEESERDVFETMLNSQAGAVDELEEEEEEEEMAGDRDQPSFDLPPVSQWIKRDAFGRPIRYQEAEAGEFEGFEEEEGFGEEDGSVEMESHQGSEQDLDVRYDGRAGKEEDGFRLEDLVEESVKEADRQAEEAATHREQPIQNLGTIELESSEDEAEPEPIKNGNQNKGVADSQQTATLLTPSDPLPLDAATLELISSAILNAEAIPSAPQLEETLGLGATSRIPLPLPPTVPSAPTSTDFLPSVSSDQFLPETLPLPLPSSVQQDETAYDSRTPSEAQGELLDVDQVRLRELERLPFLQDAESGNVFEGYEDEEMDKNVRMHVDTQRDVEQEVRIKEDTVEGKGWKVNEEVHIEKESQKVDEDEGKNDSGQDEGEEGEFFGEGVPGDEVVPGRELESEDEGSDRRATPSEEDSEDLGSRIPWQAKGKGKALPSPSVDSDDPSRYALSDLEELASSSDDEDIWQPDLLFEYDLTDLERLMRVLSKQLRQTRTQQLYMRILQQLQDTQDVYRSKGGELIDDDDEDEAEDEHAGRTTLDAKEEEEAGFESEGQPIEMDGDDDPEPPRSPDRSAFIESSPQPEPEDAKPLDPDERHAEDQVLAIASQLVDLQSSSNPFPSLHIGTSTLDHPGANLSSHFRQEDIPQPKLDDPINLPPPPATTTNVDEPVESQQQDEELNIERVVMDEQQPIELPAGPEASIDVEVKEQIDQVDSVRAKEDDRGLVIVDDDENFASSVPAKVDEFVEVPPANPASLENTEEVLPRSYTPQVVGRSPTTAPAKGTTNASPVPTSKEDLSPAGESTNPASLPLSASEAASAAPQTDSTPLVPSGRPSFEVPNVNPPVSSISNPTSLVDSPSNSPFVPLPPSTTTSIARRSGPDLSRFSSHFRYEPTGPPPPLDAPLNLPAPPTSVTKVDEPIIRQQQDSELEPEVQVSIEEETNEPHKLSEMIDLSQHVKPKEADDFEKFQPETTGLVIVDDDAPGPAPGPREQEQREIRPKSPIPHRSRIGATPPPSQLEIAHEDTAESMIEDGTAPPQNDDLTLPPLPRSPTPPLISDEQALPNLTSYDSPSRHSQEIAAMSTTETSAADEIRFDDLDGDQTNESVSIAGSSPSSPSSSSDDNDAEVALELLSPHKRAGGVLGFSGGAEEFGETIVMNDDSDEDALEDAEEALPTSDTEEINLDLVKEALRQKNLEEERAGRQVSDAPSSEPISYASSDEQDDDPLLEESGDLRPDAPDDHGVGDNFEPDFGGGLEDTAIRSPAEPHSNLDSPASPLRIHDVLQPGEWDPSQPIEFGDPATQVSAQLIDHNVTEPPPEPTFVEPSTSTTETGTAEGQSVAAVVEMSKVGASPAEQESQSPPPIDDVVKDVAESVVEAVASAVRPANHLPAIEVDPEVIEEALRPVDSDSLEAGDEEAFAADGEKDVPGIQAPSAEKQTAAPGSDQSQSGDEIVLASRTLYPPVRRSPRRPTSALPEEGPSSAAVQGSLTSKSLDVPTPIRRSTRLSSAGPGSPLGSAPHAESSLQGGSISKGKRARKSDETGAASLDAESPVKKPRKSGHSAKLREEFTEEEEPVPSSSSGRGLRVHHHHHPAERASTPSGKNRIEPPHTRSRCHFTRLRISPLLNKDSSPYEFLVPACALTSVIAVETMRRASVVDLGPVDESMHCRGVPLGGRGFDADAAQLMNDRHPSRLVPDQDVLDVVRRIVGTEIFDEGEVELLPRQAEPGVADNGRDEDDREEGEIEEGEIEAEHDDSSDRGHKRTNEDGPAKQSKKRRS